MQNCGDPNEQNAEMEVVKNAAEGILFQSRAVHVSSLTIMPCSGGSTMGLMGASGMFDLNQLDLNH